MYSKLLQNPYFISIMKTSLKEGDAGVDISVKGYEDGMFAGMVNFIMVLDDLEFQDKIIENIESKKEFIEQLRNLLIQKNDCPIPLFGTRQFMKKEEGENLSYQYAINANHLFGIFEGAISDLKDKVECILEKKLLNDEILSSHSKINSFKL